MSDALNEYFESVVIPTTSRNFQSFVHGAKDLQFTGGPKDKVLQWLSNLVESSAAV